MGRAPSSNRSVHNGPLTDLITCELLDDPPIAHHEHAVAERDQLGEPGADPGAHQRRAAPLARLDQPLAVGAEPLSGLDPRLQLEAGALAPTHAITVRSVTGEKYDRIVNYQLGEKPAAITAGDLSGGEPDYVPIPDDEVPF